MHNLLNVSQKLMENNRWYWRFRFSHAYVQFIRIQFKLFWFYSKNEITAFDADIAIANILKFLKFKAKLLGNTKAETANGILKNAAMLCHQSI